MPTKLRPSRSKIDLAVAFAVPLAAGCNGDAMQPPVDSEPVAGFVQVTASTAGIDVDADGYIVTVFRPGESQTRNVGANDTVIFTGLRTATYFVEFLGVADNCELSGGRIRELSVQVGDTALASFGVSCFSSSPLKDQIVFSTDRESGTPEIYAMNIDGTGLTNISRESAASDVTPAVSPDGSQVAYSSDREGEFVVFVMNASGTRKRGPARPSPSRAATATSRASAISKLPAWAPDGSALAFIVKLTRFWSVSIAESELFPPARPRPPFVVGEGAISWSPDGTQMVYTGIIGALGLATDIFTVDTVRNAVNLTDHLAEDRDPAWSPDGSTIAFVSDRDGNPEIYFVSVDGTGITRLTDNPAEDGAPGWSPDGTKIAFETNRDGNFEIYVMNADGTGLVNLTNHPANDRTPSWSP